MKYYDEDRIKNGKSCIPVDIVWMDNYAGQYKCHQNFKYVTESFSRSANKSIIIHKFAEKNRFKGSWDATGKLIKTAILNSELAG